MEVGKQTLDTLKKGESAYISDLKLLGIKRRRVQDLGFVNGAEIKNVFSSFCKDPVAYFIRGCVVAIRNEDAKKIIIKKQSI